ncbi:hypothetical protein DSO57_1005108 [Entomophthora muscae]|uniref:Uncharacterized protein n=1 Tax=Entomophthora muscae TaxID=34485 RepID=A0ACC2SA68_9FUNG|nr:hypothetical protein DSO57_1005108 [Entomophthora muscae]
MASRNRDNNKASKKRKPEGNQKADGPPQKVAKPVTAREEEIEEEIEDFENGDFPEDFEEEVPEEAKHDLGNQQPKKM